MINQFSYPLLAIALGLLIAFGASRIPRLNRPIKFLIILAYIITVLFVGSMFQYPDSPVEVATISDVENMLINEKPTFVMLYSNY